MKRMKGPLLSLLALFLCVPLFSACSRAPEKPAVRVLIIPKFEIGGMNGDFPGEAQLFYERYCPGCEEIEIPHMPPTGHFYFNEESGAAILVTGSGKTAAGLSLMALLSSDLYDFSDAYIVSVGCGGGSLGTTTLGDVVLVTAACDYDLGHHVDVREMADDASMITWFPDDAYADYEYRIFNADLCDTVYEMTRDTPLRTTEDAQRVLAENFPAWDGASRNPTVIRGTALSGDNYWKGAYGHLTASTIAEHYGCPDPYAVTEMEEVAIANTADCFGMLDRIISFRVIVNLDVFLGDETPESTWGEVLNFNERVTEANGETLDIFEPAMHNLFDTACVAIDAVLAGEL